MGKLDWTGGIQTTLGQTKDVLRQPEKEGSSKKGKQNNYQQCSS